MKEKLKDKKTLLIVGVFLVLIAILGVSYAFFSAIIIGNEDAGENIVKAGSMKLIFVDDNAISLLNAKPGDTDSKTFTVENVGTLDDSYTYNIKLTELNATFLQKDLTYSLVEYTDDTYQTEKPDGINNKGFINRNTVNGNKEMYLAVNITRPEKQQKHYYKLTVTFENLDVPQDYNQGAEFSGKINVDTGEAQIEEYIASYSDYCAGVDDLASCMLEYADKFESFVATDDPDHNARFMGADPNNYVYFNCEDYSNPSADTCELWRIIGSFNDIELADGGTKNLVKIIRNDNIAKNADVKAMDMTAEIEGLRQEFDSMYEQMKDEYCPGMEKEECFNFVVKMEMGVNPDNPIIYGLSWDYRATESVSSLSSRYSSNDWTQSTLMKTLNSGNELFEMDGSGQKVSNSLYWNRQKGICWSANQNGESYDPTIDCDFSNIGLRTTTQNMIENVKWHIGGSDFSDVTAKGLYTAERGTVSYGGQLTTWDGKVALMYPSDYLYATSGNAQGTLNRNACLIDENGWYDFDEEGIPYSDCFDNDWLLDKNNSNMAEWTLAPGAGYSNVVFRVLSVGLVSYTVAYVPYSVRPSLYLDSRVNLVGGVGTKSNPYVIKSA